jgi:hypothetical protein
MPAGPAPAPFLSAGTKPAQTVVVQSENRTVDPSRFIGTSQSKLIPARIAESQPGAGRRPRNYSGAR